jgi:hypothetical protein
MRGHEESAAKVSAVGGIVGGGMKSRQPAHFELALYYVSCAQRTRRTGALDARLTDVT